MSDTIPESDSVGLPLPDGREWWTPTDIAACFGLTDRAVRNHCRRLFGQRTRYRLTAQEAHRVYRYIHKFGKPKSTAPTLQAPLVLPTSTETAPRLPTARD